MMVGLACCRTQVQGVSVAQQRSSTVRETGLSCSGFRNSLVRRDSELHTGQLATERSGWRAINHAAYDSEGMSRAHSQATDARGLVVQSRTRVESALGTRRDDRPAKLLFRPGAKHKKPLPYLVRQTTNRGLSPSISPTSLPGQL